MEIKHFKSTPVGQERTIFASVKSVDQANPNLVHAAVSSGIIDRYNEIMTPEAFRDAIRNPHFVENNVVLSAHQHKYETGEPPVIGNVLTETYRLDGVDSLVDILFDDDELSSKYARKYRKKVMRAFSIGFRGLEGHYEQRDEKQIWLWTKIELLEISAVAVPACQNALSRVKNFYEQENIQQAITDAIKKSDPNGILQAMCQIMHEDMNQLGSLFNELKNATAADFANIEQQLEDIKAIIIANSGGLAEREHGGGFELPEPGGDERELTVRILETCQEISSQE